MECDHVVPVVVGNFSLHSCCLRPQMGWLALELGHLNLFVIQGKNMVFLECETQQKGYGGIFFVKK